MIKKKKASTKTNKITKQKPLTTTKNPRLSFIKYFLLSKTGVNIQRVSLIRSTEKHVTVVLSSVCTLELIKASLIFFIADPVLLMLNHTCQTYAR